MHINICSLINKIDLVRNYICDHDIDCLSISETWLRNTIPDELLQISGYNLTRLDRPNTNRYNRGGGICVYTKCKYDVELLANIPAPSLDLECIGIKLSCNNINTINCITVYRPPKGDVRNCISIFYEIVSEIRNRKKHNTIIHGDFNINYENHTCRWAKELKDWESSLHLNQLVKIPTRVTENTSSMMDLCFTDLNHIQSSGVLNTNMSDHFPTFALIKKTREVKDKTSFVGRSYANFSLERMEEPLNTRLPVKVEINPNLEWEQLEESFLKTADDICPMRNFEIHNDRPEYFSDKLSSAIKKRDTLFRKARIKKDRNSWDKAKKKKKEVRLMLKKEKKKFIMNGIDQSRNNVNKFWRNVSNLLGRKKTSAINEILDSQGKIVKGKEAANEINSYFCKIGPNLASKVPSAKINFPTKKVRSVFVWGSKIRPEDTIREIEKLDTNKSSGIPLLK